jgi:hypothetical protein
MPHYAEVESQLCAMKYGALGANGPEKSFFGQKLRKIPLLCYFSIL